MTRTLDQEADLIDGCVDELKSVLLSNATNLGGFATVYEMDEHPAIPANDGRLPAIYVLPLVGSGIDHMDNTMTDNLYHTFPISVVAYYEYPAVESTSSTYVESMEKAVRAVRKYGYRVAGFFAAVNSTLGKCAVYGGDLELGYWEAPGGRVIYYFIYIIYLKTLI